MADGFRQLDYDCGGNLDLDELTAAVEEFSNWKADKEARLARRKLLLESAEREARQRASRVAEEYAKDWVHYPREPVPPSAAARKRGMDLASFSFPSELPLEAQALDINRMAGDYVRDNCDSWREMNRQALYHIPPSQCPDAIQRRQRRRDAKGAQKLQRGIEIQHIIHIQRQYRIFSKRRAAWRRAQKAIICAIKLQSVWRGITVRANLDVNRPYRMAWLVVHFKSKLKVKAMASILRKRKAATLIQSYWRARGAQIKFKARFKILKQAVAIIERAWIAFSFRLKILRQARRRAATFTLMLISKTWNYTGSRRDRIPVFEPLDKLLTRLWDDKIDLEIKEQEEFMEKLERLKETNPTEYKIQLSLAKQTNIHARQLDEYGNIVTRRPAADYNLFLSADHIGISSYSGKGKLVKPQ